jgi:hypothetical protein
MERNKRMKLYYAKFLCEHMTISGHAVTDYAEEIVFARDSAHLQRLLSRWYVLANIAAGREPVLEEVVILLHDVPKRRKGGILEHHEYKHYWTMRGRKAVNESVEL